MEEEVKNQENTLPSGKELTEYKKKLRAEVEMLELEARHVKARVDYVMYNMQLEKINAAVAGIMENAKAEQPIVGEQPVEEGGKVIQLKKNLK